MHDYIERMFKVLFDHALKAAHDRCFTKHDPSAAVRIMYLARVEALIGVVEPDKELEDALKCLTFKLDFTTNGPFMNDACGVYASGAVEGLVLRASAYTGSQAMVISGVAASPGGDCGFAYSNPRTVAPLQVFSLDLELHYVNDPAREKNPPPSVSDIILTMDPGDVAVDVVLKALPDQKDTVGSTFRNTGGFGYWHRDEGGGAAGFYRIDTWEVPKAQGAPFVAHKTYDRPLVIDARGSLLASGMTEHTKFTLTHAPGA